MQKLGNIDKWESLQPGSALAFGNVHPRTVRLEVNSLDPAGLYYVDGNGEVTFIGRVLGRDVVEFKTVGEFSLQVEGGEVWFYTLDSEEFAFEKPDAVSLTRLVERRQRNPDIERIEYLMRANMEAIVENQRVEMERILDQRDAARRAEAAKPAAASASVGAGTEHQSAGGGGASDGDNPADGGDSANGGGESK